MSDNSMALARADGGTVALPAGAATGGNMTAVETATREAEIQAMVVVAQRLPRDEDTATLQMQRACSYQAVADRAFFEITRAGKPISGPTIHLAKELARIWHNIRYGVVEVTRGPGWSDMKAFAWDLESNSYSETTFRVRHAIVARGEIKPLVSFDDVYMNNANQAARRVREMILNVLPVWFVEEAKARCMRTLQGVDAQIPMPARIAKLTEAFHANFGITKTQLEQLRSRPSSAWSDMDLAQLRVLWASLSHGETSVAELFPERPVTADDLRRPAGEKPERKGRRHAEPPASGDSAPSDGQPDSGASEAAAAGSTPPAGEGDGNA